MNATLEAEIEQLRKLRIGALRSKYRELFGDESRSFNKQFLFQPTKGALIRPVVAKGRDLRLPAVGAVLRRRYRGRMVEVKVLDRGFEFEGRRYDSLSALASEVTGMRWNGFTFFGLARTQRESA